MNSDMALSISDILDGIDRVAIHELLRGTYMEKYQNLRYGAHEAMQWAEAFGLVDSAPQHILDIGCGIGMFCRVCNLLRHTAVGIDQPGYMHAALAKLMGIQYDDHEVTVARPLPGYKPESFDTVTMMHVSNPEGAERYAALAPAVHRLLKPGGRWWIVFHYVAEHWVTPYLWSGWWPSGVVWQRGSRVLMLEKPK